MKFLFVLNTLVYLALVASQLYMDCFPIYHVSCVSLEHPFSVPKLYHQALVVMLWPPGHSTSCISFLSF